MLAVYDINGQLVKQIVNEYKQSGSYSIDFDGSNFASGVYFYKLTAGNFVETKRLTLIK
jgi:flagellar hook assembly protein FlgD